MRGAQYAWLSSVEGAAPSSTLADRERAALAMAPVPAPQEPASPEQTSPLTLPLTPPDTPVAEPAAEPPSKVVARAMEASATQHLPSHSQLIAPAASSEDSFVTAEAVPAPSPAEAAPAPVPAEVAAAPAACRLEQPEERPPPPALLRARSSRKTTVWLDDVLSPSAAAPTARARTSEVGMPIHVSLRDEASDPQSDYTLSPGTPAANYEASRARLGLGDVQATDQPASPAAAVLAVDSEGLAVDTPQLAEGIDNRPLMSPRSKSFSFTSIHDGVIELRAADVVEVRAATRPRGHSTPSSPP